MIPHRYHYMVVYFGLTAHLSVLTTTQKATMHRYPLLASLIAVHVPDTAAQSEGRIPLAGNKTVKERSQRVVSGVTNQNNTIRPTHGVCGTLGVPMHANHAIMPVLVCACAYTSCLMTTHHGASQHYGNRLQVKFPYCNRAQPFTRHGTQFPTRPNDGQERQVTSTTSYKHGSRLRMYCGVGWVFATWYVFRRGVYLYSTGYSSRA